MSYLVTQDPRTMSPREQERYMQFMGEFQHVDSAISSVFNTEETAMDTWKTQEQGKADEKAATQKKVTNAPNVRRKRLYRTLLGESSSLE